MPFQFPMAGFPQMPPPSFSPFQFPQFGQQPAQGFQFPQFPGFNQPAGQSPFPWFPFFQPPTATMSPKQAAIANYVSPFKNQTSVDSLYPQFTQPAVKVPVSDTDYWDRQRDAGRQAQLQKMAKYPAYPPPMVPVSKIGVQLGGPPADMWGNTVDEDFDRKTGQLLVPSKDQNPPPLISLPPSPDDITQNF